ncbi:MAG: POTRA domain-containing protein, partial [Bacteroidota bacterium]
MGNRVSVEFIGRGIAIILLVLFSLSSDAQTNKSTELQPDTLSGVNQHQVYIDNIFITGNKRTRDKIILRELSFSKGEVYSIDVLRDKIEADRDKIYNTKLFNTVEVGLLELDIDKVDVVVKVEERWYLFPIPLIDIIDRNFNDWWVNQNHDFSRIIYGLSLYHFNMRGMNERLTMTAQFGYSKRYEIKYEFPYIDRTQQNGLALFAKYIEYTNLHYDNLANKRVFFDSEDILKTNVYSGIGYTRRNSFYTRHHFDLRYSYVNIADTIAALNP